MSTMPSWLVRAEGTDANGEEAKLQTAVDAVSAIVAMTLVMDRTRKLNWSDVRRIEISKRGK